MISAVVLSKNGEKKIKDCLAGLQWCDEILVIDDNSTDKTAQAAQKLGAKVFRHPLGSDFAQQRNFALRQVQGDWILFIDDDERVGPELAAEIQVRLKKEPQVAGFYFKRIDFFAGHWLKHGEIDGIRLLRLARKDAGQWQREVDETWQVAGPTATFKLPLKHYSHPDLTEFFTSINERTTLNAHAFYREGQTVGWLEWLKPGVKFCRNYFCRLGFLDGAPGFVFAVLMSLHSFLVRGKLYLLWRRQGGWCE